MQTSAEMEKSDDDSENADWILESLVAYLRGPVWVTPILNFLEEKSVVFEGDEDHEEEYRQIHEQFRNLVDVMLGAYMDDLGLQPEHLERALAQIQPSVRSAALQELLEPVRAAGDYEVFTQLMKMKNEQLHYQALELLRRHKKNPDNGDDSSQDPINDEFPEDDINEAIRQSLAELEKYRSADALEERDVERALAISVVSTLPQVIEDEVKDGEIQISSQEKGRKPGNPSPDEVERRRSLLRAQRDKLLSMKRQERQKKLNQEESVDLQTEITGSIRPKSGKAAREALTGQMAGQVDERTIQYRRLLMQKIKDEVEGSPKT